MKKLLFIAICGLFISCSDDDDDSSTINNDDVAGRYVLVSETENDISIFNDCRAQSFIELDSDGAYREAFFMGDDSCLELFGEGTYEINSPAIFITTETKAFESFIIDFEDDNLIFTDEFTQINIDQTESDFKFVQIWEKTTEDFPEPATSL